MRAINIGGQGFEDIRTHDAFYIDKTAFIKEWWESLDTVTLITRPRRFGKTLNMSMLECFFSNKYAGRSDLFEGLSIWNEEKYHALQGSYPVIFLSFADVKERTFADARRSIIRTLQSVIWKYRDVWKDEAESSDTVHTFTSLSPDSSDADAAKSLQLLSDYLYEKSGRKVLIFLDEYDTPLQEAFLNGYWDEMSAFVRSLFNATFKTNPSMERAIMTGITRVSRESIFSDLNNLSVVTTTSRQYETAFGFTEQEVFASLEEYGMSGQKENVKAWYDGFTFGETPDIYNPWSITNFLKNKEFAPYWANTSSNGLISLELRTADNKVKQQMEDLMNGGTVRSVIDEQVIFSQLAESTEAIWSLFLASGYLKIVRSDSNLWLPVYTLALTNFEVKVMFSRLIRGWFGRAADSYSEFTAALARGDTELLNYYLNDILLNTASSFDTRKKPVPGHEPESFYHGLVLGLVATEQNYIVTSNRESGLGRYDVSMRPRNTFRNGVLTSNHLPGDVSSRISLPAIIIEFKVFDPKKEKNLEDTADRALLQITEKKYDAALIAEGFSPENILHYGMGFCGKEAVVKLERCSPDLHRP